MTLYGLYDIELGMVPAKTSHPWTVIERLRSKKGVSKKVLAERLGINYSYLVDLLNGRYPSKIDNRKLSILAEVFEMPIEDLLGELSGKSVKPSEPEVPTQQEVVEKVVPVPPVQAVRVPIISMLSGEVVKLLLEEKTIKESEEQSSLPAHLNQPDTFGIRLQDDSMLPPFAKGSIFVVSPEPSVQVNHLVLTTIRDGRTWVRELWKMDEQWVILKPYNEAYDHLQIERKDITLMYSVVLVELKVNTD